MTDKLLMILKIGVVVLVVVALGMGGWLLYSKFIKKDDQTSVATSDSDITIVWWTLWENSDDLEVLAEAYEEQNPNVDIVIEAQEIESQYKSKVLGYISDENSVEGPDILRIHNTWMPQFENYLSNLPSTLMSESEYSETFYDTALTDLKGSDGRIYAIPLMYDGLGLYYNKTLLKEAGYAVPEDNWDDFVTQAIALTQVDDDGNIQVAGVGMGSSENIDFAFEILSLLMLQEGASIVDSAGKTTFSTDSEMKVAKAIKFYTDFATRYEVWDRSLSRDITMFTEGRLAMMFAPSWRVYNINDALDSVGATLDYDIATVPQQPTVSGEEVNWADYWAEAVSAKSDHPEVAWDFLQYVSQSDQLKIFYEKASESRDFGEIYPRKDMAEELISEKYVSAYIKMADTSITWRMVDKAEVSSEFESLIEEIVVSGGGTVNSIQGKLDDLAESIDPILQE